MPLPALVGAPLVLGLWIAAIATHGAAQIAGPLWLAAGAVVYVLVRGRHARRADRARSSRPRRISSRTIEGAYSNILVPLKLGPIGEEVLATAVRLAEERDSKVSVLLVLRVPLDKALDAPMPDEEQRAAESLAEIAELAAEHKLEIDGTIVRARALGEAIVDQAREAGRRPDRHGLRAALAPPVALLQPDRRLRAAQGALRGDGRRLPPGRPGGH